MKTSNKQEITRYVNGLSKFQQEIIEKVRMVVLTADPSVKEGMKWGSVAFFNEKNICGFRVAKDHVTLLFMEGADLKDNFGILEGSGKKARTVKMATTADIPEEAIGDLVQQAIRLGL